MHPRSRRTDRVSRTASTTASSARTCAALKSIRAAIDGKDLAAAKTALKDTISLIDKMASKGIIHRNAAGAGSRGLQRRLAARA